MRDFTKTREWMKTLPRSPSFWYLATPYTKYEKGIQVATDEACRAAAMLIAAGHHVFSPIAHSHPISLVDDTSLNHQIWLDQDQRFLAAASGLIVVAMPGWDQSFGINWEIDWMVNRVKSVYLMPWPKEFPE